MNSHSATVALERVVESVSAAGGWVSYVVTCVVACIEH
jgi:hypothetical protein